MLCLLSVFQPTMFENLVNETIQHLQEVVQTRTDETEVYICICVCMYVYVCVCVCLCVCV